MSAKITVTFEGVDERDLRSKLADVVLEKMLGGEYDAETGEVVDEPQSIVELVRAKLQKRVDDEVESAIRDLAEEAGKSAIAATVEGIIADGVPQTDEYGKPKKIVPWKDFVFDRVVRREGYNRTSFSDIAAQCIDNLLKGELAPVMREAVAKIKAEIDTALGAKLKESIRSAVGV